MNRQGTALITGAARRLGRSMALSLASQGYDLILHYHQSHAEAEVLQHQLADFGATAHLVQGDLQEISFVENLIQQAHVLAPDLNLLINNASIFYPQSLIETDVATLNAFMHMHLTVPMVLSRDFAKFCQQGQIINLIDSQVAKYPTDYAPYILSKKSLMELTLLSAKSLGPAIRVNAIAPGYILPPVAGNKDDGERQIKRTPLARMGNITDITQALTTLVTQSFLTGQIMWIDGGHRL